MGKDDDRQQDRRTDAERFDDAMSAILAAPKEKVDAKIEAERLERERLKRPQQAN